jgi:hypothetical protein
VSATEIAEWVLSGGLLVGIGYTCARSLVSGGQRGRLRLIARRRAPRARRAAVEAALDDPVFAPERIEASVATILRLTEALWHGTPAQGLRGRPDEDMIRSWAANSRIVLGSGARITGRIRVDILSVVNREREAEDRVVARVRVHVERGPRVELAARRGQLDERWTLVHRGQNWYLAADAGDPLAESLLSSPLIASPQDDAARLREASLEELTARAGRDAPSSGDLVDPDAPPLRQLQDLSITDDRFEPLLIEAAVRHIVEAWEQSSDGSDAPLLAVATGAGAYALNFPPPGAGRRRVRDARVQRWEVTRLDAGAAPPQVDVRVRVKAAAWTDEQVNAGEDRRVRRLELVWTLELDETTHRHPRWRLTNSSDAS